MTVMSKNAYQLDTTAELMCLAIIETSVRKRQLQASEIVEMSLLQALLQGHVVDGMNLLRHLELLGRCSSLRQVHDHQSAKFGIPTTAG
jgi:hypothetical protein